MRHVPLLALVLWLGCASGTGGPGHGGGMSQQDLAEVIRQIDPQASGEDGGLEFVVDRVKMACISDAEYGRMRIVAPIRAVSSLSAAQIVAGVSFSRLLPIGRGSVAE